MARSIASGKGLSGWVEEEVFPGGQVATDNDLSEYARTTAGTVYHPAGTCRIGEKGDPLAVVDPQLRVRGIDKLRVADASVFPSMIGVNPNMTVMMIGERYTDFVLEDS